MKYDMIIAIDPDVEKSGVAQLITQTRSVAVYTHTFPEVCEFVRQVSEANKGIRLVVVVEAGWMNTTNWHLPPHCTARMAADIGKRTGRNHETGRKICEMCRFLGVEVVEHIPLVKRWKGKGHKITQEEIMQFVHGLPKRMNQDARDATLLAWTFANFPIRLKC